MTPDRKCILVTGGAGFIGSHLCRRIMKDGHRVISLDNYFTGTTDNHVLGVDYRRGHTRDIAKHVSESPDLVFHLGEYSRVEKSFEDPMSLVWDLNTAGTFAVLEFCRVRGSKLVYAGSSTKFAEGVDGQNQSPYAWTKATNTNLVRNYGAWFGLKYAITYFYNVYGDGEISSGPYSTLMGIFKEEYKRGMPLTVVSPGTQTRAFTHISDIVDGLVLVGECGEGDGYGIGNERAYSILEVAKLFDSTIVMLPSRTGNRQSSALDALKTRALGWEPRVSLETYIHELKASVKAQPVKEGRVLVFTTTFFPTEGPAERALRDCIAEMKDVHFDVITTVFDPSVIKRTLALPNVTIHRIGRGNRWDKYRLIREGQKKAEALAKEHSYLFLWSIMASYAAMSAVSFHRGAGKSTPLLISLADQSLKDLFFAFRWMIHFLLRSADQISTAFAEQEEGLTRLNPQSRLTLSNRQGDVFANQVRYQYNQCLKRDV